jgi:hypothetical protein
LVSLTRAAGAGDWGYWTWIALGVGLLGGKKKKKKNHYKRRDLSFLTVSLSLQLGTITSTRPRRTKRWRTESGLSRTPHLLPFRQSQLRNRVRAWLFSKQTAQRNPSSSSSP